MDDAGQLSWLQKIAPDRETQLRTPLPQDGEWIYNCVTRLTEVRGLAPADSDIFDPVFDVQEKIFNDAERYFVSTTKYHFDVPFINFCGEISADKSLDGLDATATSNDVVTIGGSGTSTSIRTRYNGNFYA